MLLVSALGGVFFLEQPGSSLMPRHDRFLWMIKALEERGMRAPGQKLCDGSVSAPCCRSSSRPST